MSAGLIEHLKHKTNKDDNVKILLSQWEFDQKLVGKALENIASYYPHFSSHNESHSHQILVNIERLLGDNIHLLSATDTWLLLESAYWHDIGMLFNNQEVLEVVNNKEFKEYIENLANDNTQDLHDFAKVWHLQGWQNALVMYDNPILGTEKYRQLIAEWYRRKHPTQSQKVISDPFLSLGINSPRTELLPKRIYRYLGQICLAHGASFEQVINNLPYRQTGMGTENCHPRFVACLLRLGDLFDIDDNRFCPVMMKQVVSMPTLSMAHHHKHLAIREFQLDNQTVSITAECQDEQSYIETQNWFEWLKEEMQNQMSQWKNIVPHRKFGLLPTIQKLDVKMTSSKILLNNKPMKFSLDEKNAIELLQGSNLYDGESNIYRELIQNAIDATYLRIWIEHGIKENSIKITDDLHPFHEKFQEILKQYPIDIDFKKLEDDLDSDVSIWQLSITDKGTGISLQDLQYMQKIAGSSRNIEKKRLMQDMPIWMRPSGAFGIGLHSAFLLLKDGKPENNKIIIETTSITDNASYKIEMTSPLSGNQGYCFIEKISQDEHMKRGYGTKLMLNVSVKNRNIFELIEKIKFHRNQNTKYHKMIAGLDILSNNLVDDINIEIKKEKIIEVIKNSPFYFQINKTPISPSKNFKIWNKEYNLYYTITDFNTSSLVKMKGETKTLFKGQTVGLFDSYEINKLCLFGIQIDFYGLESKEVLNFNRNYWSKDVMTSIINDKFIKNIMSNLINHKINEARDNINSIIHENKQSNIDDYLNAISIYYFGERKNNNKQWKNINFFPKSSKIGRDIENSNSFSGLIDLNEFYVIEHEPFQEIQEISNNEIAVDVDFHYGDLLDQSNFFKYFVFEWYKLGGFIIKTRKEYDIYDDSEEEYTSDYFSVYHLKKHSSSENFLICYFLNQYLESSELLWVMTLDDLEKCGLIGYDELFVYTNIHKNLISKNDFDKNPFIIMPFKQVKINWKNKKLQILDAGTIFNAISCELNKKEDYVKNLYTKLSGEVINKISSIPELKDMIEIEQDAT